jgi:hypothetical protein
VATGAAVGPDAVGTLDVAGVVVAECKSDGAGRGGGAAAGGACELMGGGAAAGGACELTGGGAAAGGTSELMGAGAAADCAAASGGGLN